MYVNSGISTAVSAATVDDPAGGAPAGIADDLAQAASNAAAQAGTADFSLNEDRIALDRVMRDNLAESALDQSANAPQTAGHRAAARAHVFSHVRHERAAWQKLAASEHHSAALHKAAKIAHHRFAGTGVALRTTPRAAAAIAAGEHQIPEVNGVALTFPSQDLGKIESTSPTERGQTHGLTKHVGKSLEDNIARLRAEPHIRAAGGYFDLRAAQRATDETIANPANQSFIKDFLSDPGRTKAALRRVDLGADVGASTMRKDLDAGRPSLVGGHTATVVLIKDPTFPEGYRTLTSYPDAQRAPEVDKEGGRIG